MESDPAHPLCDDVVVPLHDAGEIGQDEIARATIVAAQGLNVEGRGSDDMIAAIVAGAAHIGDVCDHVDGVGVAAGGRIEKRDVAGGRDHRHRRAGGIAGQDSGRLDIAFAGAAGEAEGKQGGNGRCRFEQAQGGILESGGDASYVRRRIIGSGIRAGKQGTGDWAAASS
jgi:hypothetical protein